MIDYRKVLLAVCPHGNPTILDGFASALPKACLEAELSTNRRMGLFIGQCAHESAGFSTLVEYASGRAYEGRRDLGNTQPGDGPRFKGRGVIELTGRVNYDEAGKELGVDLIVDPSKAAQWPWAATTAAWFWHTRHINEAADIADEATAIYHVTERVNGGLNGLASRTSYTKVALAALADLKGTLAVVADRESKKATNKAKQAGAATAGAAGAAASTVHPATVHAVGAGGIVLIALLAAAVGGLAVYLAAQIRKHQDAADALVSASRTA